MSIEGIDLSGNNGNVVEFTKVYKAGVRFVFFKVNEGDLADATTTARRVKAAKDAGLIVGGYNFLRPKPGRTGGQEFDIFYHHAKAAGLLDRGCLRPVADVEATGFTGRWAKFQTRRYVYSWLKRCKSRTGYRPIIYTGSWFWDGDMAARNPHGSALWLADYSDQWRNHTPKGWRRASFHQYTATGRVRGVTGNVDRNLYLSTRGNLLSAHCLHRNV